MSPDRKSISRSPRCRHSIASRPSSVVATRDRGLLELAKLGRRQRQTKVETPARPLPHGMIILTGPTGSGRPRQRRCCRFSINRRANSDHRGSVSTNCRASINRRSNRPSVSPASALRAFVRQDPDVIMVGEVRDAETANVVHAADRSSRADDPAPKRRRRRSRACSISASRVSAPHDLARDHRAALVRMLCDRCKIRKP